MHGAAVERWSMLIIGLLSKEEGIGLDIDFPAQIVEAC